eukprot:3935835-Rhodomonas_salina.1
MPFAVSDAIGICRKMLSISPTLDSVITDRTGRLQLILNEKVKVPSREVHGLLCWTKSMVSSGRCTFNAFAPLATPRAA